MKQLMAIPVLCAQQCTITGVISSVGVLTALAVALLQSWRPLNGEHQVEEPQISDEPLRWKLQPPFLLFIVIILLDICHRMLSRAKLGPTSMQISEQRLQATALRLDAAKLSSPETFVQAAKLQRRAIAADKAIQLLTIKQEFVEKSWAINSPRTLKRLVIAAFMLWYWSEPVLRLNPSLLWPFGWWFATPHYRALLGSGAITAGPWVIICQAASSLLCQLY